MKGREIPVTLEWYESALAADVGNRRQCEALKRKIRDKYGFEGDGFQVHIHGAAGELAFAKAATTYWGGSVNTYKAADVGPIHIRTRSGHGGREDLIVRRHDPDDAIFVLVVGEIPSFSVVGWIKGSDAKQEKWKKCYGGRPPAFFVPRGQLRAFPIRGGQ